MNIQSSANPDRLAVPIHGGNKAPSIVGSSSYRSKDPNFARTINDRTVLRKGARKVFKIKINPKKIKKSTKISVYSNLDLSTLTL
jgi:hypothetical protein